MEQGSGDSKRKDRSNRLYSGGSAGKNAADEGKGLISGEEPFAYHPEMGRYADLHNHLLGHPTHPPMNAMRIQDIKSNLESNETAQLLEIWKANDRANYSDEAFEAVKQILAERSVSLPAQRMYVWKDEKSGLDAKRVESLTTSLESKDTNELLEIWRVNDRSANSNETFEAIRQVLGGRNVALPPQERPGLRRIGKGVIYWGGFLLLCAIIASPRGPSSLAGNVIKLLMIAGGASAFAVCFGWYYLARIREQRGPFQRFVAGVLFILGTLALIPCFEVCGDMIALHGRQNPLPLVIFPVVFPLILLAGSFLLYFKRGDKPAEPRHEAGLQPDDAARQRLSAHSSDPAPATARTADPVRGVGDVRAAGPFKHQLEEEWEHVKEKCPHCGELVAFVSEVCPKCRREKVPHAS